MDSAIWNRQKGWQNYHTCCVYTTNSADWFSILQDLLHHESLSLALISQNRLTALPERRRQPPNCCRRPSLVSYAWASAVGRYINLNEDTCCSQICFVLLHEISTRHENLVVCQISSLGIAEQTSDKSHVESHAVLWAVGNTALVTSENPMYHSS